MKSQLLLVPKAPNQSFSVRHDHAAYFLARCHYHTEIELVYITKGSGRQFIGNHESNFTSGDILLVGSNLPHCWRCDDIYYQNIPDLYAEAKVVHFLSDFWGEDFKSLPEITQINGLLKMAQLGISVSGKTKERIKPLIDRMLVTSAGTMRIILLLEVLNIMAFSKDLTMLNSCEFQYHDKSEMDRLNEIYRYTTTNFIEKITLEEIASVACLSVNSFCRYFKYQTNKTYSQFLNEIRIGHACKLLVENKLSVSEICHESGFNNFSNFNRYFKLQTGQSPLEYKKSFSKKNHLVN